MIGGLVGENQMALGLVGIGMGLGVLCGLATLLFGGGWLWALGIYALIGCGGIFAGAGLLLWRGHGQTDPHPPRPDHIPNTPPDPQT